MDYIVVVILIKELLNLEMAVIEEANSITEYFTTKVEVIMANTIEMS
jgi:hypothetical protein